MTEFRRIVKPLLVILLQFSESHQIHYEFVAQGKDVTLPCKNVEPGQHRCSQTTWIHEIHEKEEETLINQGNIGVTQRVNLTKDCSLLIKDVGAQEAGLYTCKQYDSWTPEQSLTTSISLSIVSLSEVKNSFEGWDLKCAVAAYQRCTNIMIEWLNKGSPVTETHPRLTVNKSNCCSSVRVPGSLYNNLIHELTCEVTYDNRNYQFNFSAERQEESTIKPSTTTETQSTKSWNVKETTQEKESTQSDSNERRDSAEDRTASGLEGWWWAVIAAAGVLLITAAIFVTWRRVKGKPLEPNNVPSAEEGVSYASVSFNKSHVNTRVRASEEKVIYSSVRNASSEDPAQLYASVTK